MSNIAMFNVDNGFVEALLRGYRLGFLTDTVSAVFFVSFLFAAAAVDDECR